MAATLQSGRERAHLGRSLLNFMRIARDAHTPDLTLGEVGDLLFTAIEVPTTGKVLGALSPGRASHSLRGHGVARQRDNCHFDGAAPFLPWTSRSEEGGRCPK
jgi:hypothetical protein